MPKQASATVTCLAISLLAVGCGESTPTDAQMDVPTDVETSGLFEDAYDGPIAGEIDGNPYWDAMSGATAPPVSSSMSSAAAMPGFTASPSATDFVVTGSQGGPMGQSKHYFPSNGDGTFDAKSDLPALRMVDGMDVADMDGDGDNDILICDGITAEVYLYTNDGAGTFTTSVVATGVTGSSVVSLFCSNLRVGDLNEDGANDFVVGDNRARGGMYVYLQTAPGTFTKAGPTLDVATWSTVDANAFFGVAVGDVDGDGHEDILVLGNEGIGAGEIRFYRGDGTGAMAAPTVLFDIGEDLGAYGTTGLAVFDLEGDGDLDIIAGGGRGGSVGSRGSHFIYTNDGSGNFTKPEGFVFDLDAQTGIDAFDFDSDGDDDLAVVTFRQLGVSTPNRLYYVENLGGVLAAPVLVGPLGGSSIGVGAPALAPKVQDGVLEVAIDIKPGSGENSLNCGNDKGVIPVAILSTDDFDATTVDHTTVIFEGASEAHVEKKTGEPRRHEEDVDGDGDTDLVFHFRYRQTDLTCDYTEGTLQGETDDGRTIEGTDAVRMIGQGSGGK